MVVNVSGDESTPLLASHQRSYQTELFFDELFQEKCNVSVDHTEISFIQKSVESFVSRVIQRVIDSEQYQTFIKTVDRKGLVQFHDKYSTDNILKVGSFYECTKNHYPDEFDFIFILGECEYKNNKLIRIFTSDLSDIFHEQLEGTLAELRTEPDNFFELCNYTGLHGPASKIKLVFKDNANIQNRIIYVDICTTSRVHFETSLPDDLKVHYDEWQEMLINTGSVLVIKVYKNDHPKRETGVNFTITETEQHFVRHEMSEKQRKIYRLLKYVFNGNEADESLRELIRIADNKLTNRVIYYLEKKLHGPKIVYDMPSYTIKTFMFHHVHQCKRAECSVPECLTEVLKQFLAVFNTMIDKHTTVFQNWLGGKKGFSVSIETMLGQPLEIADDYVSAAVIAKKVSNFIKSVESMGDSRKEIHPSVKDQIPFAHQNENIVKSVLDEKGERTECSPCRLGAILLILAVLLAGSISTAFVVYNSVVRACNLDSEALAYKSSYIEYCCDVIQDHDQDRVNVSCSYNKDIANNTLTVTGRASYRQTRIGSIAPATDSQTKTTRANMHMVSGNTSIDVKSTFARMALKLAKTSEEGFDFVLSRVERNKEIAENDTEKELEFYLHCYAASDKLRLNDGMEFIANQEKTCLSLTSSYYTPQQPPFLKVVTTISTSGNETALEHYFCVTDNCTAGTPSSTTLQTCSENKTRGGTRTEVCCSNVDRYLKGQSKRNCRDYKVLSDDEVSAIEFVLLCFFTLPAIHIFIRSKRTMIRFVEQLRSSM